jgi:hypothetical protein
VAQVVECLPSKHKTLCSNLVLPKDKKAKKTKKKVKSNKFKLCFGQDVLKKFMLFEEYIF